MAADRFINWNKALPIPSREDIEKILKGFFGDAATVEWDQDRFFVTLNSKPSFPFAGLGGWDRTPFLPEERWIEVYYNSEYLDILTRQADHFTSVLAEGLTAIITQFYQAQREQA